MLGVRTFVLIYGYIVIRLYVLACLLCLRGQIGKTFYRLSRRLDTYGGHLGSTGIFFSCFSSFQSGTPEPLRGLWLFGCPLCLL